jgi:hypothetical protein
MKMINKNKERIRRKERKKETHLLFVGKEIERKTLFLLL